MLIGYSHLTRIFGMLVNLTGSCKEAILIDLTAAMDEEINFVDLNLFIEKRDGNGLTAHKIQRG